MNEVLERKVDDIIIFFDDTGKLKGQLVLKTDNISDHVIEVHIDYILTIYRRTDEKSIKSLSWHLTYMDHTIPLTNISDDLSSRINFAIHDKLGIDNKGRDFAQNIRLS